MVKEILIHKGDITIDRNVDALPNTVVVYDADGEEVLITDKTLTDEQILSVISWMNDSFDKGVKVGSKRKQREIIKALGL